MAELVCALLYAYMLLIVVRIVLSYFPVASNQSLARVTDFLHTVTDPVLMPLRRALPPLRMGSVGIDLSPMAALAIILVLRAVICA